MKKENEANQAAKEPGLNIDGVISMHSVQNLYNKRTWLNKDSSPSLGSVVAFDGEVEYSDATERTTFIAVSDCSKTIKIIKNSESIEDFIDKINLLKTEIELFINYLENHHDGTEN